MQSLQAISGRFVVRFRRTQSQIKCNVQARTSLLQSGPGHTNTKALYPFIFLKRNTRSTCRISASSSDDSETVLVDIKVDGMMCDSCTSRVQETLEKIENVVSAKPDLDSGVVEVSIACSTQLEAAELLPNLIESVRGLGFEAQPLI